MDQTAINWVTGLQEYDLANIDSFSLTMFKARAQKDAWYNSEETRREWNGRKCSPGLLHTMTALQPKFHNVTLVCDDYFPSQGDPGGYQHCVQRASKEAPKLTPYGLCEGKGGPAPILKTRKDRRWTKGKLKFIIKWGQIINIFVPSVENML